jgi:D-2-hydroxyacid dehydrogenase (NADP+)
MTYILIAADELRDDHVARVAHAVASWATVERIPESTPDDQYAAKLRDVEILFGSPTADVVLQSNLKVLQLPSVGYDNYVGRGLDRMSHLTICNARGTMGPGIAEHILAMMLAFARHLPQHIRDAEACRWQRAPQYGELFGATTCVVGMGDLGGAIAERCAALGMRVVGVRRDATKGHPQVKQMYAMEQLGEAVGEADHVVGILPAAPETTHIFDQVIFECMKRGTFFYNIGRGSTVNEQALLAALQSNHLAGAGLDVFEHEPLPSDSPFWTLPNVIVLPHVGGRSAREYDRQCDSLIENLRRYSIGEPLRNVIKMT